MNTQDRVYKAIIFDLDGVLVDTSEYHFQAWERLADQLGIPFSREIYQEMKGMSRFDSLDYLIHISDIYLTDAEKLFRANIKNNWYIELISQLQPDALLPGVLDFLKKCKALGLKMAVVSSSRNARTVLQSVGVIEYFNEVIDGTMIKNAKPDPDRYFFAAMQLQSSNKDTLVIEDTGNGIIGAQMAGFKTLAVGDRWEDTKPNLTRDNLLHLDPEELLLQITSPTHQHSPTH